MVALPPPELRAAVAPWASELRLATCASSIELLPFPNPIHALTPPQGGVSTYVACLEAAG